jgi:tetratricopeptide (TPR) repeat protein
MSIFIYILLSSFNPEEPSTQTGQIRRVASAILIPFIENNEHHLPQIIVNPSPSPQVADKPLPPSPFSRVVEKLAEILECEPELLKSKIKNRTGIQLTDEEEVHVSEKGIKDFYAILQADRSIHTLDLTRLRIDPDGLYILINGFPNTGISRIILSDSESKESAKALASATRICPTLLLTAKSAKSYLLLGKALLSKRDFAESINYLSKGIQLEENAPTFSQLLVE